MSIYNNVASYKDKYPKTLAFRLRAHSNVVENSLKKGEKVLYTFCGLGSTINPRRYSENDSGVSSLGTCVVALTNKRIIIGHKGLLFGHTIKSIDFNKYNDMTVQKGLIWSSVDIDTFKEEFKISGLTEAGANEVETAISNILEGKSVNNIRETKDEEEVEEVKVKREVKPTKAVTYREVETDDRIDRIKSDMNRMAKKDALLRERLRLTEDPNEIKSLREAIISNHNEYMKYKEFMSILNSYDKDCEMTLKRK